MKAQLSREHVEEFINSIESDSVLKETRDFELKLAKRVLAGMESEPVGEVVLGDYDDCGDYPDAKVVCIAAEGQADWNNFRNGTKLYAAPPAPVAVPDELSGKSFEYIANKFQVSISEAQWILVGWDACRAAMLKAGPVTGWIKCSERMPGEHEDVWVFSRNGTMAYGVQWLGDAWFWDDMTHSQEEWGVTHWMPIEYPAAPEQDKSNG